MKNTLKPYIMLAILGVVGTHANASGTTLESQLHLYKGDSLGLISSDDTADLFGNTRTYREGKALARPSRPTIPPKEEPAPPKEEPAVPDDGNGKEDDKNTGSEIGTTEGGTGNTEGGTGNTEGGPGTTEGGPGTTEGGTGNTEGGPGTTEGGTENTESGPGTTEGGTENTEGGPGTTEGGTENTEDGDQTAKPKDEGSTPVMPVYDEYEENPYIPGFDNIDNKNEADTKGDDSSIKNESADQNGETNKNKNDTAKNDKTDNGDDEGAASGSDGSGKTGQIAKDDAAASQQPLIETIAKEEGKTGLAPMARVLDTIRLNAPEDGLAGKYWNTHKRGAVMQSLLGTQPLFGVSLTYLIDDANVPLKLTHFDYENDVEKNLGAEYVYERGTVRGDDGLLGFNSNMHGIKVNYFRRIDEKLQTYFEGKYLYSTAKSSTNAFNHNAKAHRFSAIAEGFYSLSDHSFIDLQGVFLKGNIHGTRQIVMNDRVASMNSDATQYQLKASAGYKNDWLKTYVGLERKGLSIDPYKESGADAFNLAVDKETVVQNNLIAGVAAIKRFDSGLKLHLEGTLKYQLNDPTHDLTVRFVSHPEKPFTLKYKASRLNLGLHGKATYPLAKNLNLTADVGWERPQNKNLFSTQVSLSKKF